MEQHRPLQARQLFVEVHRKPPLANHGPEKMRRKAPNRPNIASICAAHGGGFLRGTAREMGLFRIASAFGEKVIGLAGGQRRIRTHGSDLMVASHRRAEAPIVWDELGVGDETKTPVS